MNLPDVDSCGKTKYIDFSPIHIASVMPSSEILKLYVANAEKLNPEVRMLRLRSKEGRLPPFEAGAHIDVQIRKGDGQPDWRQYSLITLPGGVSDEYVIAVRLEEQGRGGSAHMHRFIQEGDEVSIRGPRNDFPLSEGNRPILLIGGGIGITPLLSMAHEARNANRPVRAIYAGRSRTTMAFLGELESLLGADLTVHADDEQEQFLDARRVLDACADDDVFVCGPPALLKAVLDESERLRWPKGRVNFELFGVSPSAPSDSEREFEVVLAQSNKTLTVPADKSILEVLIDAGLDPLFDCRRGECGVCCTAVISGEIDHRDFVLTQREKDAGNVMHTCVSRCFGPRLVLDM